MDTASIFVPVSGDVSAFEEELYSDNYNDVEHLLMREMVDRERLLTMSDLVELSDILDIDVNALEAAQSKAESKLYNELQSISAAKSSFSDEI